MCALLGLVVNSLELVPVTVPRAPVIPLLRFCALVRPTCAREHLVHTFSMVMRPRVPALSQAEPLLAHLVPACMHHTYQAIRPQALLLRLRAPSCACVHHAYTSSWRASAPPSAQQASSLYARLTSFEVMFPRALVYTFTAMPPACFSHVQLVRNLATGT